MAMKTQTAAVETKGLGKSYRGGFRRRPFVAVEALDLTVPRGQVFGFLGPNGAGKTTTIMMLLGNVRPSRGRGWVLGEPIGHVEAKRRLGFLPEKFQFHDFLQADEFLDMHGKLYGMPRKRRRERIGEVLELVGLAERRRSRLAQFSKGMQQRIGLAQALLHEPELVILDEPTSALDPIGRRQVRDIVLHLKGRGATVFLNSHLLSEIEMTCDQVAILHRGRLVRQGTIDELLAPSSTVELQVEGGEAGLQDALAAVGEVQEDCGLRIADCGLAGNDKPASSGAVVPNPQSAIRNPQSAEARCYTVRVADARRVPELAEAVVRHGGRLHAMVPQRESLEDFFIRTVAAAEPEPR
jgi:ABC-2 type transport system ATP-binding protein